MKEKTLMKRCDKCDHYMTLQKEIWLECEWTEAKPGIHYPARHTGCGGQFVSLVTEIGGKA